MKKIYTLILSTAFCFLAKQNYSQCLMPVNFTLQKSLPTSIPLFGHDITAKRDTFASKPYLYVAGNEQGLKIFNITSLTSPTLITTIPTTSLGNLNVSNMTQGGTYLYLALGSVFSATAQATGMAIVDVANPNIPVIKSVWTYSLPSGANCVTLNGNIAYLGAMQNGIIVLDVTNKSAPVYVSKLIPTLNFPKVSPNSNEILKINSRAIVFRNNILYVCDDAGGFRTINASNPASLKETGRYCNAVLSPSTQVRAYNNLVLNDTLAYVAIDYAGMEILNIKDTANIKQVSWWNPWKAGTPANTWFNSPGHTNDIEFDSNCKMLFMSAGRSDLMAVSVANPLLPDSCSQFGIKTDSVCSYGMSMYKNQLYVGFASTWPFFIPFAATWSGVKILTYNNVCSTGINELSLKNKLSVYPNPANGEINIKIPFTENSELLIYDAIGNLLEKRNCNSDETNIKLNLKNYSEGVYFIKLHSGSENYNSKFVVSRN